MKFKSLKFISRKCKFLLVGFILLLAVGVYFIFPRSVNLRLLTTEKPLVLLPSGIDKDRLENIRHCQSDTTNSGCAISKLTYDDLAKSNADNYLGEVVQLKGKISSYTHIDGVKFWPADKDKKKRDDRSIFWATSFTNKQEFDKTNSSDWLNYIMNKFASISIDKINTQNDTFLITGVFTGIDDSYFDAEHIVPNIEILSLSKIN